MNKVFPIFILIVALTTNVFASTNEFPKLGIVSELVNIKYGSECFLTSVLDTTNNETVKLNVTKNYNAVKVQIDKIIFQLAADMRAKNSITIYRRLNKYYETHKLSDSTGAKKSYKKYVLSFEKANKTYEGLKSSFEPISRPKNGFLESDAILSIAQLGWTIIKDINEMRGNKVDGIVDILNNLRLSSPNELNQEKE